MFNYRVRTRIINIRMMLAQYSLLLNKPEGLGQIVSDFLAFKKIRKTIIL